MKNIVAITPDRSNYIEPIREYLNLPLVFLRSYNWNELLSLKPALVIFLGDWKQIQVELIQNCKKEKIPSVLMMDGTIEWKHFFENPKWSYGGNEAPYLPIYCDKVFVPGLSTYRFLEFFGNSGKCEVTGLPRFDGYKNIQKKQVKKPLTIGIISGNTAGYTKTQIAESVRLFEDIYHWAEGQKDIRVIYRLRKGFEDLLSVKIENDTSPSLAVFLEKTTAVISQPSTAAYEAMLLGIPTAIADYNIAPNYMSAAWRISSKEHIESVADEIVNPSKLKVLVQEQILNDTLSFIGSSAEVSASIINKMIDSDNKAESSSFSNETPKDLLVYENASIQNMQTPIFANRTNYQFTDFELLEEEYIKLKVKNNELNSALKRRGIGFWIELVINKILK